MNKQILDNEDEILKQQYHLEKIALSFWTPFSFTSTYCITYPLLMKYRYAIPFSFLVSYLLTGKLAKYYSMIFNSDDYSRYKTFCLKYKLYSKII